MNDKIKEIREYISCPQFGDDHYGKWGALRLEQRIKIKSLLDYVVICDDYITNLQKENEKLKERCDYLQRSCDRKEEQRDDAVMEYMLQDDYKSRIDKAIEYIKENDKFSNLGGIYEFYGDIDELLRILKGDDENEK